MKKYILFSVICMVSGGMSLMGMEQQQVLEQLKNRHEELSERLDRLNKWTSYGCHSYVSTGDYEAIVQEREHTEEKYEVHEQLDNVAQQIELLQQRLQHNDHSQP